MTCCGLWCAGRGAGQLQIQHQIEIQQQQRQQVAEDKEQSSGQRDQLERAQQQAATARAAAAAARADHQKQRVRHAQACLMAQTASTLWLAAAAALCRCLMRSQTETTHAMRRLSISFHSACEARCDAPPAAASSSPRASSAWFFVQEIGALKESHKRALGSIRAKAAQLNREHQRYVEELRREHNRELQRLMVGRQRALRQAVRATGAAESSRLSMGGGDNDNDGDATLASTGRCGVGRRSGNITFDTDGMSSDGLEEARALRMQLNLSGAESHGETRTAETHGETRGRLMAEIAGVDAEGADLNLSWPQRAHATPGPGRFVDAPRQPFSPRSSSDAIPLSEV